MKDLAKRLGELFGGEPDEHDWCSTLRPGPFGMRLPRRPPAPKPDREPTPTDDLRTTMPGDSR